MPRLRGPRAPAKVYIPPRLGLPKAKAEDLEVRVQQLLFRWKPMTEDPNNLARDVYELLEWILDADEPTCPLLRD